LFIRTRRGMQLTSEGEALLNYCRAVAELEGEALAKITGAAFESEVQFGISGPTSIMHSRIIPACLPIMKKYPFLFFNFDINDAGNRVQSLRASECQLAILRREDTPDEMEFKILQSEYYVIVCSSKWKKRSLKEILRTEKIIDYDPSDQLTFDYLRHFNLLDAANLTRCFVNRTDSLAMMIASGYGYGVLTREFSQPYIAKNQLIALNQKQTYEQKIVLAWYHRPQLPKYFADILAAIH
jgi:LysR family transcriptional regulator (chromosome initiation inhibitor)